MLFVLDPCSGPMASLALKSLKRTVQQALLSFQASRYRLFQKLDEEQKDQAERTVLGHEHLAEGHDG